MPVDIVRGARSEGGLQRDTSDRKPLADYLRGQCEVDSGSVGPSFVPKHEVLGDQQRRRVERKDLVHLLRYTLEKPGKDEKPACVNDDAVVHPGSPPPPCDASSLALGS